MNVHFSDVLSINVLIYMCTIVEQLQGKAIKRRPSDDMQCDQIANQQDSSSQLKDQKSRLQTSPEQLDQN